MEVGRKLQTSAQIIWHWREPGKKLDNRAILQGWYAEIRDLFLLICTKTYACDVQLRLLLQHVLQEFNYQNRHGNGKIDFIWQGWGSLFPWCICCFRWWPFVLPASYQKWQNNNSFFGCLICLESRYQLLCPIARSETCQASWSTLSGIPPTYSLGPIPCAKVQWLCDTGWDCPLTDLPTPVRAPYRPEDPLRRGQFRLLLLHLYVRCMSQM